MTRTVFPVLTVLLMLIWSPLTVAQAADLGQPSGNVILTVSGNISNTNNGQVAEFDRTMLQQLTQHSVTMPTPWTEGPTEFEGFRINDLLQMVGAEGREAVATALNDYSATIPMADLTERDVLIAMKMNGQPMRIRDKGPLWVVFPVDPGTGELSVLDRDRMVWQLNRLTIR